MINSNYLMDKLYSVPDIQDYFVYIIKNHETLTHKPPIRIFINRTENRIKLKLRLGTILTTKKMKLLRSTENRITKDKNGENVPHLEITEVIFIHCSVVNNSY